MKIVTPLTNIDCYQPLVEAGSDEFYTGIMPFDWLRLYNNSIPINRREYLNDCNICDMSSMRILSRMVEKYKMPVKIAFNSHYYCKAQYDLLLGIIKKLIDLDFDTFIMADLAFILFLREKGVNCKIHLSGECLWLNSININFLNKFNIQRYVFPRKTTTYEIENCIHKNQVQGVEFEAFILNEICPYIGAFCNTIHCDELPNACQMQYKLVRTNCGSSRFAEVTRGLKIVEKMKVKNINNKDGQKSAIQEKKFASQGCGICRIRELMDIGVNYVKVVGRGKDLSNIINDVKNIKHLINAANSAKNHIEFEKDTRLRFFNNVCPDECYYPKLM